MGKGSLGSLRLPGKKNGQDGNCKEEYPMKTLMKLTLTALGAVALACGLISFAYQESKDRYVVFDEREEDL
jgi:hypothetical protein